MLGVLRRGPILALLALAPALLGGPTHAQTFQCTAATAGQLSEQAGVQCECRHFHASAMQGTPQGYRWDCGILRPRVRAPVIQTFLGFHPLYPFSAFVGVPRRDAEAADRR